MPVCSWGNTMPKVLLTGATGFIGSHIAELFAEAHIPLKCLVRASSDTSFLKQLNSDVAVPFTGTKGGAPIKGCGYQIEIVEGDITSVESISSALTKVDCVIHTAGKSSDWGIYRDFYQSNVTGTMNVMRACKSHNISHIIITGSISSYGEEDNAAVKNEDSPLSSHYSYFLDSVFPSAMNYYRDTKALLTRRACKFAAENHLNLAVLEPAWVYGEREFHTGFFEYMKAVQAGMRYAPGSKTNQFHVIYARDLAEAYLLAYQTKLSGVNRFIIGNPAADRMNDIYSLFCQTANLTPPKLLPRFLVYPIGLIMELIATIFSRREPPLLTRSRVNMMYDNISFSVAKARHELGFEARTPLRDGIRRTVDWYLQNGLLK